MLNAVTLEQLLLRLRGEINVVRLSQKRAFYSEYEDSSGARIAWTIR